MGEGQSTQQSPDQAAQPQNAGETPKKGEHAYLLVYEPENKQQMSVPGFGIYHSGIQIYGTEYSFAGGGSGTGVYAQQPKSTPAGGGWTYKDTLDLGVVKADFILFQKILKELQNEFPSSSYNLITKNCNHFTEAACNKLGVKFPDWVNRAAKWGAAMGAGAPGGPGGAAAAPAAAPAKPNVFAQPGHSLMDNSSNNSSKRSSTAASPAAKPGERKNPWRDPNFAPGGGVKQTRREDMPALSAQMRKDGARNSTS